ncbi:hypothetical protein TSOC_003167 [Tetrabaena socialis]|uniref:Uncharacterized protein n=1 Tax=Tetrabaena socialis TaxID=47790 RepID=A0A2J8ACA2_9CHLO|nr:hypothetical protein TSOC_003167 [Tetrabaena socialis]|eukprot:PNH10151.1 hypothetical protein TSOC_003167 [Tetrabaena socialis]
MAAALGRLAVLLPITSKGCGDVGDLLLRLRRLRAGFEPPTRSRAADPASPGAHAGSCSACSPGGGVATAAGPWVTREHVCVCIGLDEDDGLEAHTESLLAAFDGLDVQMVTFSAAELAAQPPGPLCWMWGRLAEEAVGQQAATHVLLLGDDTRIAPDGWPETVLRRFAEGQTTGPPPAAESRSYGVSAGKQLLQQRRRHPLRCLLLRDAADPGYPSFPVVAAEHLEVFGGMFPPGVFVNQVGDPFLAELYRRLGGLGLAADVAVHNDTGGIQLPDDEAYVPPRYERYYPPVERVLQALEEWTARGAAAWGVTPATTVDVLVPCGRAREADLRLIVEGCSRLSPEDNVEVRFCVVVDVAANRLPADVRRSLEGLFNACNRGASHSRNRAMDESLAQLLVLLDDDVVPQTGLLAAYARAAQGFVGPTYLPSEGSAWAHAVHMSDVAFFWEAAANNTIRPRADGSVYLPWAVTANMAVRNTPQRFDPRFPRTGGGEDIDFCLRACPGWLLAVPQAACCHPLWNFGRPSILRFARWAVGDGQLIEMYPRLTYRTPLHAAETLLLLGAVHTAAVAAMALLCCAAATAACWGPLAAAAARFLPAGTSLTSEAMSGRQPVTTEAAGGSGGGEGILPYTNVLCTGDAGGGPQAAGAALAAAAAAAGAVRIVALGSAVAAVAVVAAELLLELVRHCANRARLARHPCPTWRLRLRAALLAALLRNTSEAGRLYGHVRRAFGRGGGGSVVMGDGAL